MSFDVLFQPIKIGNVEVKNRFVVPPMDTGLPNDDGTVNERTIAYYAARAKGGFGLIIIEYTHVNAKGKPMPHTLGVYDDKFIPGLTELAAECHKYGAKVFLQLHHAGRASNPMITGAPLESASAVGCPIMRTIPRELSTREVYDLIEEWGDAAVRAKKAGFDGVELHGGHGYLIHQFMSGGSNKRVDEFGGDFRSRMRFPELIIKNIKAKCGDDFPISMRVSGDENVEGGKTIDETRAGVRFLEKVGLAAVNVSVGNYASTVGAVPPNNVPIEFNIYAAESIKKSVGIPVIGGGRVHDPYYAEDIVGSGRADMIFIGRGSLADPEFPNKVKEGKYEEITKCICCMQRCSIHLGNPKYTISCMQNPFTGKESEWFVNPAEKTKKIVVVGAGPAGLEFAWLAAKRGHEVVVLEKADRAGGQLIPAAVPPYKHEIPSVIKTKVHKCEKYNVTIKYNTEATEEVIASYEPDEVVLATGGVPSIPPIPGIDGENVIHAIDILKGKTSAMGNLLILGGGEIGLETADFLVERFNAVTVMEMLPEVGKGMNGNAKNFLLRRLSGHNTKFITNAKVVEIHEGGVSYEQLGKSDVDLAYRGPAFSEANKDGIEIAEVEKTIVNLDGFSKVIIALGSKAYNPLSEVLKDKYNIHVIGDAVKARTAVEAIEEAAKLAITI